MSWDVSIFKFRRAITSLTELSDDDAPFAIGTRAQVHAAVAAVFSDTDWSDAAWGMWESEHGSIEFNLGTDDPADGMMLHVRAAPAVIPLILDLCEANGWLAVDCSEGEVMTRGQHPERGLEAWQAFRDQVIDDKKISTKS